MAEDGSGGLGPQIKRNGPTFRQKPNRGGAPGRYHDQGACRRGRLCLNRCRGRGRSRRRW
jgi:hypothetical protein